MYHKKVWIIILIIVVASLFPSVLYANADEGDGGGGAGGIPVEGGDVIPDREYSLKNAPIPGAFQDLEPYIWQAFLDRADDLGHTIIKRLIVWDLVRANGDVDSNWISIPIFYTTDGLDVIDELEVKYTSDGKKYSYVYDIKYADSNKVNILRNGIVETSGSIGGISTGYSLVGDGGRIPVSASYDADTYYRADVIDDPYQDNPEKYNIDPTRGLGMWFVEPENNSFVNVTNRNGQKRGTIEIDIQIPQEYIGSQGLVEKLYEVSGHTEKSVIPNFAIRLTSSNVKKIYGLQVVGKPGDWILSKDIKFIKGYMDGSYMHGALFRASVPIDYAMPADEGSSLIVADLYIYDSNNSDSKYNVMIPEARTWVRYYTYLGIIDEDGDGLDDRTGKPYTQVIIGVPGQPGQSGQPGQTVKPDKPNKDDYDDGILGTISYYFDTFIWYIKQPFVFIADLISNIINWISTTIDGWIDGFTSIFTKLFSFLPAEVILMLALGFSTMMIITIIRAIRGS